MNLKNLTAKLRSLSAELAAARNAVEPDGELIGELEAQIADVEDQIEEASASEYDDHHNKEWH